MCYRLCHIVQSRVAYDWPDKFLISCVTHSLFTYSDLARWQHGRFSQTWVVIQSVYPPDVAVKMSMEVRHNLLKVSLIIVSSNNERRNRITSHCKDLTMCHQCKYLLLSGDINHWKSTTFVLVMIADWYTKQRKLASSHSKAFQMVTS